MPIPCLTPLASSNGRVWAPVGRVKGVMRIQEGLVRINRQGDDLHIETQSVAPPDSRVELISNTETDWNTLQTALLKLRLATHA